MTSLLPRLMIFAKAPVPGRAKTRLIPLLGEQGAAELQGQLLQHTLSMAVAAQLAEVQLWVAGQTDHPELRRLADSYGLGLHPQQGRDLGERMAHAMAVATEGGRPALIIGSDCPSMDAGILQMAIDALRRAEVVLQPAEDGGYTLIGLTRAIPSLFTDIDWGGPRVLEQSLARAASRELTLELLPMSWDVDVAEDYRRAVAAGMIQSVQGVD